MILLMIVMVVIGIWLIDAGSVGTNGYWLMARAMAMASG